jgi:hypothetical protein
MPIDVINCEKYTFKIDVENQFMEFIIKPDITIDVEDVREAKRITVERYPNMKFFVLAQGVEFFTLTKEARSLSATKEHLDNTTAIAFYTGNASLQFVGNMYLKIDKPHVPTKIFSNLNAAKEWLQEQMKGKTSNN